MMKKKMNMLKRNTVIALSAAMALSGCLISVSAEEAATEREAPPHQKKARVIISQDGEVDDMNSLIHTLLYANDIDIAGIVQSSSQFHYSGGEDGEPYRWPGTDWMEEFLSAYENVYPNLIIHDPDYPTADELRAVTKVGNVTGLGEMDEVTEGSELIKDCILDDDERKLYIAVGGGANTVGRALKSIEETYKDTDEWSAVYDKVCGKVVIHAWGTQDNVYEDYISVNWPDIPVYNVSGSSSPYGYGNAVADIPAADKKKMEGSWMYENIETGHGALLDKYVTWGDGTYLEGEEEGSQFGTNEDLVGTLNWWGGKWMGIAYNRYDFLSEGDSPDWIVTIPTGLRNLEDESYGGWGGRYVPASYEGRKDALYFDQAPEGSTMCYWIGAIQDDFAARADWCITDKYEDANHQPKVSVTEGTDLTASAGETVLLNAVAEDPDGDEVSFKWWQYAEADTYEEKTGEDGTLSTVEITTPEDSTAQATIVIPEDAKAEDTIHIILEATDNGEHTLKAYQRVIITIA